MPQKKAKTKIATEPQQTKETHKVLINGLPPKEAVEKEFEHSIVEFKKRARCKAFWGNVLMYAPFIALILLIFVTISGWLIGVLTTIASIIVGQLIGKFMNWATGMAVKGEMELKEINRFIDNKSVIVNMLVKDITSKKVKNSKK